MQGTLEKIGLSKDEIQVYSNIVQYGFRTVGQIQTYVKISADKMITALKKLVDRGYVKEVKAKNTEGTSYYIPLPPQIKLTEDVSLRLENELKTLSDEVKVDWNKTMQNFRTQLAGFHENITQEVDAHSQEVGGISKQFLETMSSLVDTGKNELTEIVGRVNSETSTVSSANSENIAKSAQRVKENVLNSFDSTIHKIGEHHETFKLKIEETFGSLQQEHNERINVQLDAILEKMEGIKESLSLQLQTFLETAEGKKKVIDEVTRDVVNKIKSDSKTSTQDSTKKLTNTLNKIVTNYETKLDEHQEKTKLILASLNEELKKLEEATTDRIKSSIDKSKETAVNILKENENQFVNLLNKTKTNSVEKLGVLITQTEGKTEEMKNKLSSDLSSYLKDFKKNSDGLLSLLKKGIDDGFNLFKDNLSSSIEKVSDQVTTFIDEIMTTFEESTSSYLDDLSKTAANYQKSLDERIETFTSTHDEFKQGFTSHLNELKENVVSNIVKNVKDNDSAIKDLIQEKETQFNNDVQAFSDDFSKRGRDIRDEVPDLVQIYYKTSLDRLNEISDQFKSAVAKIDEINSSFQGLDQKQLQRVFGKEEGPRMAQLIESMNRDIELLKGSVGSKVEDMILTFSDSMTTLSTGVFQRVNTRLDELSQFTNNTIQSSSQSLEKSRSEISNQLSKSLDEMKKTIKDTYTTYEEQFTELQDTSTSGLKEVVGAESKAFSGVIKKIKDSLDDIVKSSVTAEEGDKTTMQLHLEEGLNALQTTKKEIFTLMKGNNEEVLKTLQETLKTNIDDHTKLVTKVNSSMDTNMKTMQSEFETAKNALDTDVSVTLDEAAANYTTQTEKVESEINDLIDQEIQQFLEGTEELLAELNVSPEKSSELDAAVALTKEEMQKLTTEYPKLLKKDTDSFSSKLAASANEFQALAQAEIDTMYEGVKKDLEKSYDKMATDFESNITSVKEEFDKDSKDYDLNVQHQISSFVTNSDSNSSALVTNVQGTRDTLTDTITSGNETIKSDLTNLEKTVSDLFESLLSSFIEKLDKIVQDSQIADSQKTEYNSKLMSFKEDLIKSSLQEVESVDTTISGLLNTIPGKIDVVLEATGDSMKILRDVLSLGKGIEPNPVEDMWLVTGNEQVRATMMSLLRHTKSSATIISPTVRWIDSEFMDTFGRKLEIVTNTSQHNEKDKALLTKMLGMGNVTVKDDPQLTVMMGTRDGIEEGFLGHKAPSGDPVMVTTFNERMVSEITKIYYDYRSRAPIRA